jgi:hypothetical protein
VSDLHVPDPAPGEDERVDALHAVLRGNGVGGAAPFTIEGEIQGFGNVANGVRRSGWRRFAAYAVAAMILGAIALGTLVTVQSILRTS